MTANPMNIAGRIHIDAWECDHFTMFYGGTITIEDGRTYWFDGCDCCASKKLDEILDKEDLDIQESYNP